MNLKSTPISQLIGRKVVLKRDLRNRGRHVYKKGNIMVIVDRNAGRLDLAFVDDAPNQFRITGVRYDAVELVDQPRIDQLFSRP